MFKLKNTLNKYVKAVYKIEQYKKFRLLKFQPYSLYFIQKEFMGQRIIKSDSLKVNI